MNSKRKARLRGLNRERETRKRKKDAMRPHAVGLIALVFLPCFCVQAFGDAANSLDVAVVHPKTRLWAAPSGGIEARCNPPSLAWPVRRGATYAVRLSQARDFSEVVIEQRDIPYGLFNPHQQLATGVWYWQYKTGRRAWSAPCSFVITEQTPVFVSPPVDVLVAAIAGRRPRLLVWDEPMAAFRERAQGYQEAKDILQAANAYLKGTPPREEAAIPTRQGRNRRENAKLAIDASKRVGNAMAEGIKVLTQAYVLSGEARYAAAGKAWALAAAAWKTDGPARVSNFGDSNLMVAMAYALDSLGELLSPEERNKVREAVTARARLFYADWINNIEAKAASMHVWQYILHRFLQTAVGLVGEVPEAEAWLAYAYDLWLAKAPILGVDDGAWSNGVSYFCLNGLTLLDVPAMLEDYSGLDFVRSAWYGNNPQWLIYAFPPHSTCDGFGNSSEKLFSQHLILLGYADALARVTGNRYASWYGDRCLEGTGWSLSADGEFRWYRLQRGYRMPRPAPVKTLDLPDAAVFRDIGLAYLHSDLSEVQSDLMVSFRSGLFGSLGHMHADQNTFTIAYGGERLFFNSGYRPAMGDPHYLAWFKHTQGHNGVLIDGQGQPVSNGDAYGWIPRFLHGKQISYAVGDATHAYSSTEALPAVDAGLRRFRRHLILLRPSILIVYDDLAADHEAAWSWLIHSYEAMELDAAHASLRARNAVAEGRVALFGSVPFDSILSDQFSVKPENWRQLKDQAGNTIEYHDQWHFKAVTEEKTAAMRYLAFIQVLPTDAAEFAEIRRGDGGRFEVGAWRIQAELRVDAPPWIHVVKKDESAALVSSGSVWLRGEEYAGTSRESSKLVENMGHGPVFLESLDARPASMADAGKMQQRP